MPHDGQVLPLAALRGAAALMGVLIVVGCTGSGDVVVVLDSTMGMDSVEVVALPTKPRNDAAFAARLSPATSDSVSRLQSLDDSAAALETRFRVLRDSLNAEVQALDTADRRTRSYEARYAAIRRRTLAAETLRASRDSVRTRADRLRARLGPRAGTPAESPARDTDQATDGRGPERRTLRNDTLTLSLPPGPWWIGVARHGKAPARYDSLTVERGVVDTIRLRPPGVP
jgi:hypothetical protein